MYSYHIDFPDKWDVWYHFRYFYQKLFSENKKVNTTKLGLVKTYNFNNFYLTII